MTGNTASKDSGKHSAWQKISGRSEFGVGLGLIILFVVMCFASPVFFTMTNIMNVLTQISRYAIIAVGMALVIVTTGIDLSVGYAVGLCATTAAYLTTNVGMHWLAVLLIVLLEGAAIGVANGLLVTRMKLPAFIVTLAMGKILYGCTMLLTSGRPISFESPLGIIGSGYVGPVPMSVIIMFLFIVAGSIFAQKTQTGRNIYAIGNNARAAALSGINVKKLTTLVYIIESVSCAFCGIMIAGNLMSADATLGTGYDTDTIAAVVIGGVSLTGGEGTIWGTFIGAAIMGILKNAFVLLNISSYWQSIVIGLVIIAALTIDRIRVRGRES